MIRLLFVMVLLFALPTVLYALWLVLAGLRRGGQRPEAFEVEAMPWRWLATAGAVCAALGVAGFIYVAATDTDRPYRPTPPVAGK